MPRSQAILRRLPAHFEPARPAKVLGVVVEALARDLDVQTASLAAIRRAHRLFEADELADVLLIAARHGIGMPALALLMLRFARAEQRLDELVAQEEVAARNDAAERLLGLWGIAGTGPRLALFADPPEGPEPVDLGGPAGELAVGRVVTAARTAGRRRALIAAARDRIAAAIRIHAEGNGTVRALLAGAANALDLDIREIRSSPDRYRHASFAFDRLRLRAETEHGPIEPTPAREVIGLEENPLYRTGTDAAPRRHAELFDLLRRGFERATLQTRVTGEGGRTIAPMLVNRDDGHGVGYAGSVPGGQPLVFEEGGRVRLGGADVTAFAYAWRGGAFADREAPDAKDQVFAADGETTGRSTARFALATPAGALDPEFAFPHAGDSLPMPSIAIGRTRFAFFVQEAHHSLWPSPPAAPTGRRVAPRPAVGFFDGSVFAPAPGETRGPSALVSLSWLERRAHAVRIVVPARFRALEDDPEGVEVRRRLVEAVHRFRPAGIAIEVAFVDDRWMLGQGMLAAPDADDPLAALSGGTVLWPAPEQ